MKECDPISSSGLHKILPDLNRDILGARLRGEPMLGENTKPCGSTIRESFADERADLFPPLLKESANEFPLRWGEDHRCGFSHKVEEKGTHLRAGVETGGGDRVTGSQVEG